MNEALHQYNSRLAILLVFFLYLDAPENKSHVACFMLGRMRRSCQPFNVFFFMFSLFPRNILETRIPMAISIMTIVVKMISMGEPTEYVWDRSVILFLHDS